MATLVAVAVAVDQAVFPAAVAVLVAAQGELRILLTPFPPPEEQVAVRARLAQMVG
jgi:hypothetical protein